MNPQAAIDAVVHIPTNGDPVLEAAKWVFLILIWVGILSLPFLTIMNKKNKDRNENTVESAIAGAGSTLYSQLVKQMEEYRTIANTAYQERNDLIERVGKLEAIAEQYRATKEVVERLRVKLDLKDQEIRKLLDEGAKERETFLAILTKKDSEIIRRDERILTLERSMHELELRLIRDESSAGFGAHACPFTTPGTQISDSGAIVPRIPIAVVPSDGN